MLSTFGIDHVFRIRTFPSECDVILPGTAGSLAVNLHAKTRCESMQDCGTGDRIAIDAATKLRQPSTEWNEIRRPYRSP
jgi:hypothetical protein